MACRHAQECLIMAPMQESVARVAFSGSDSNHLSRICENKNMCSCYLINEKYYIYLKDANDKKVLIY
jgi:hypothetical protein